jgi:DNA-binding GntR family transcriptional regulator
MIDYMDELVKNTNFNQNKPITEIVYDSLRTTIINGVIPAGERIVEKGLDERFNISRTPIREALKGLEIEELLDLTEQKNREEIGRVVEGHLEDLHEIVISEMKVGVKI